jgi:predicted site-specific integrase-resolvase
VTDSPQAVEGIEALLRIEDVAALYGVRVSTIRRWRELGLPPHGFVVGKHLRWSPETIRTDLERRRREAESTPEARV